MHLRSTRSFWARYTFVWGERESDLERLHTSTCTRHALRRSLFQFALHFTDHTRSVARCLVPSGVVACVLGCRHHLSECEPEQTSLLSQRLGAAKREERFYRMLPTRGSLALVEEKKSNSCFCGAATTAHTINSNSQSALENNGLHRNATQRIASEDRLAFHCQCAAQTPVVVVRHARFLAPPFGHLVVDVGHACNSNSREAVPAGMLQHDGTWMGRWMDASSLVHCLRLRSYGCPRLFFAAVQSGSAASTFRSGTLLSEPCLVPGSAHLLCSAAGSKVCVYACVYLDGVDCLVPVSLSLFCSLCFERHSARERTRQRKTFFICKILSPKKFA